MTPYAKLKNHKRFEETKKKQNIKDIEIHDSIMCSLLCAVFGKYSIRLDWTTFELF